MKLLIAAAGQQPDDFSFTTPGELVMLAPSCSRVEYYGEDNAECGCARTFAGLASRRGTTVAAVVELDTDLATLAALVADSIQDAGWDVDPDEAEVIAAEMVTVAEDLAVGALVRRSYDELVLG